MSRGPPAYPDADTSEIIVQGHTSRPTSFVVRKYSNPAVQIRQPEEYLPEEKHDYKFEGFGLFWEADAVARCLKGEQELRAASCEGQRGV